MLSSQGGDGGDKSDSTKNRIVMKSNEWKFRVTCGGSFTYFIYFFIALQQANGVISFLERKTR